MPSGNQDPIPLAEVPEVYKYVIKKPDLLRIRRLADTASKSGELSFMQRKAHHEIVAICDFYLYPYSPTADAAPVAKERHESGNVVHDVPKSNRE